MAKFFEFDLTELIAFGENITDAQRQDQLVIDMLITMGRRLIKEVKKRTPVDTGRMKKQWDIDNADIAVIKTKGGYSCQIINTATNPKDGTMYPSMVEEGFHHTNGRWIVGRWFLKASEAVLLEKQPLIIETVMRNWIKESLVG